MRHLVFALVLLIAAPSLASAETTTDRAYPVRVLWKLGRGLHNLVGAPSEIPVNAFKEAEGAKLAGDNVGGVLVGGFTGTFTGVGYMFARMGVGLFDVVTFPVPTGPVMQPATPDGFLETLAGGPDRSHHPPQTYTKQVPTDAY
jgi:putative exosortase-associated protein (TIGR04073 family)